MNLGSVSETIRKRSILKFMKADSAGSLTRPALYQKTNKIAIEDTTEMITVQSWCFGNGKDLGIYGVMKAANELHCAGANLISFKLFIALPDYAHESRIKSMVNQVVEFAKEKKLMITDIQVSIQPFLSTTMVITDGVGKKQIAEVLKGQMQTIEHARPGQSIVMAGYAGLEGSIRILGEKREELLKRFTPGFLNPLEKLRDSLYIGKITFSTKQEDTCVLHADEGGIYAALWELSVDSGCGFEVDGKAILIRQESIEVCEQFGLNPYQLTSAGVLLFTADDGEELVLELQEKNIPAAVIGSLTKGRDKVIASGEERRFLDRPAPDELFQIYVS